VTDNIRSFSGDRYLQVPTIFLNSGKGLFEAGPAFDDPHALRGAPVADFDGDGRLDVVVTAPVGPAELWLNRTTRSGHWLKVELQGTRGNCEVLARRSGWEIR
jgi:hypothetical protein